MQEPWLIAGLGNPGEQYSRTRHNVGRMLVETVCARLGTPLRKVRLLPVMAADARAGSLELLLAVPTTFMNVSGPPIASLARRRGIPLERVIVCHDDLDLPFGALRVKRGGSTAGHHGLESLVQAFRSADFNRVRIGVGRPAGRSQNVGFLLGPFSKAEREEIEETVGVAADAALSLPVDGLTLTQSRYNRAGARSSQT